MANWINDLLNWKPNEKEVVMLPSIVDAKPEVQPLPRPAMDQAYNLVMGALTIWKEARGEPPNGKLAVWWVIKNRVYASKGKTVSAIVLEPNQFSCWNNDDPNLHVFPDESDPSWTKCLDVVVGSEPDPTHGARFYFNPSVVTPHWSLSMIETIRIGNHAFYKEGV